MKSLCLFSLILLFVGELHSQTQNEQKHTNKNIYWVEFAPLSITSIQKDREREKGGIGYLTSLNLIKNNTSYKARFFSSRRVFIIRPQNSKRKLFESKYNDWKK